MGGRAPGAPPPRSANELGCQANGGARAGRAPLDPPMIIVVYVRCIDVKQSKFHINNKRENREEYLQIEIDILHNPQE